MHLTHIRLLVSDFDACFRFYRDVVGFKVLWGEEGSGYADFQAGDGALLALFGRRAMAEAIGQASATDHAQGMDHLMLIFEAPDLEAQVQALKARGVQFVADISDHPEWGIRTAYCVTQMAR